MVFKLLRRLAGNIPTVLLAFILAVVVWVSAVNTADPNEERTFRPVPLEKIGQNDNLLLTGNVPDQVSLTLQAPHSILDQLNNNPGLLRAWIDLTGIGPGQHNTPVRVHVNLTPVRLVQVEPAEVNVGLEKLVVRQFPVQLTVNGDPPLGYKKGDATRSPAQVSISGPESLLARVSQVQASLNIAGANETVSNTVTVEAVDSSGKLLPGVKIEPKTINVMQPISLLGGFKNVVVKVNTIGQVANGYRLTSILVTPPTVTVFSSDPQRINQIPGYVETKPVGLYGLKDDVDMRVDLNLPDQVTLVGEQSVLVQVGVAAIEGSLTITLPLETLGLPPEYRAIISPASVDVIVSGPLPVLDALSSSSFRAVVDLSGVTPGVHKIPPVVDLFPQQVKVETILPETVEVSVALAPTATPVPPTPTPAPVATIQILPTGTIKH